MSKLEDKILMSLDYIGYEGPLLQKPNFPLAIEGGPKSVEYTKIVHFLTNEIRTLLEIDEEVNEISSPEDSIAFIMEVTSFLKELSCPYKSLIEGHVSDRLQSVSDKLLLLDYLQTELMGARILQEKRPSKKIELKLKETPEGKDMRLILQTLRFPKPPANISIATLFQKLVPTIPIVVKKAGKDIIGRGIFNGFLSSKQWEILNDVQEDLHKEYKIRREMLLTRLDVTIQSFQWSDRTKGKDGLFEKLYHERRKLLKVEPDVSIADLIAARTEIAIIEKTSNSSVRRNTQSAINKVIIGSVPDRGGRTSEIAPPPPEMPSWQQRSGPAGGGGRGGGNFNRGGGNFNRGGGNFNRGGGNFNRDGGNNYSQGRGNNYSRGNDYSNANTNLTGNTYQSETNYQSGGGNYHSGGRNYQSNRGRGGYEENKSFDSAGSYSSSSRPGSTRNYESFQGKSRSGDFKESYDSRVNNYNDGRRDREESYSSQDFHQYKKAKTYDSFQADKTTYADQYVQERQHNQQYYSRGDRRGSGYSSHQRGGRDGRDSNYR